MTLSESIAALVNYGVETGLTPACEKIYTTNLLLDIFHEDDYEEPSQIPSLSLEEILKELLDEAVRRELIPDSIPLQMPETQSAPASAVSAHRGR